MHVSGYLIEDEHDDEELSHERVLSLLKRYALDVVRSAVVEAVVLFALEQVNLHGVLFVVQGLKRLKGSSVFASLRVRLRGSTV